jgi:hypothetical protein
MFYIIAEKERREEKDKFIVAFIKYINLELFFAVASSFISLHIQQTFNSSQSSYKIEFVPASVLGFFHFFKFFLVFY